MEEIRKLFYHIIRAIVISFPFCSSNNKNDWKISYNKNYKQYSRRQKEIRRQCKNQVKEQTQDEAWMTRIQSVVKRVSEMIYKENRILFPNCAVNFTKEDWIHIYHDAYFNANHVSFLCARSCYCRIIASSLCLDVYKSNPNTRIFLDANHCVCITWCFCFICKS